MPKMEEEFVSAGRELRREPQQEPDRQTDHVGDVAFDLGDERRAESLDGVAASSSPPLAAGEIRVDQLGGKLAEGDPARLDTRPDLELALDSVGTEQRQRSDDVVRSAGERLETPSRLSL